MLMNTSYIKCWTLLYRALFFQYIVCVYIEVCSRYGVRCREPVVEGMASSNSARPPEPLNLEDRAHRGENWKNFKRERAYYEIAAGIASKTEKVRVAALLNVIGRDALNMNETFRWDDEADSFKTAKVLEKFEKRCLPARNKIFDNFFKRNQNNGAS